MLNHCEYVEVLLPLQNRFYGAKNDVTRDS